MRAPSRRLASSAWVRRLVRKSQWKREENMISACRADDRHHGVPEEARLPGSVELGRPRFRRLGCRGAGSNPTRFGIRSGFAADG